MARDPVKDEAERDLQGRKISNFVFTLVLPIALALLGAITPEIYASYGIETVVIFWVVLGLIYLGAWFRVGPSSNNFLTLAIERNDLKEQVNRQSVALDNERSQSQAFLKRFLLTDSSASILRSMSVGHTLNLDTSERLNEAIKELLYPLHVFGGEVIGFEGSEEWGFWVYLMDEDDALLKPIWRELSANHPSKGKSRSWKVGQGHVGKAFADGEAIFTLNSNTPDVLQLCSAPTHSARDYDSETYRSFVSIPFPTYLEEGDQLGVLTATSNKEGRFGENEQRLLKHFADTIGSIILLSGFDVSLVFKENSDDTQVNE